MSSLREMQSKIDGLWNIFWTGGLTNPLDVIEQITYLMYIRDLDRMDTRRAKESNMLGKTYHSIFDGEFVIDENNKVDKKSLKWSEIRNDTDTERAFRNMGGFVFPFIKTLHGDTDSAYSKYMQDAIFKIPTAQKFSQIIDALDNIFNDLEKKEKEGGGSSDIRGDIYEYLLSKLSTAGTNGQFRTPRHIIEMMVRMMDPQSDDIICDPAFGTAGFLVAACEFLRKNKLDEIFKNEATGKHFNNEMFYGYDMDRTMLRIGAMNMMSHGVENPHIEYLDSLSGDNKISEKFTLVLTNPPFKGSLDAEAVANDLLKVTTTKKTELLFLVAILRMLKVGGRCASIVPDGVLFGSSKSHKTIRKLIVDGNRLEAVISMPSGVFKPYAGVSTAILIFTKTGHGGTDNVWYYDMEADGYSLDDKRSKTEDNDIPDIIARFKNLEGEKNRERTEKSFLVPVKEIRENDYDLSINKYKKVVYVQEEYPPTKQLIAEIRELDRELNKTLDELEKMLQG